MTGSILIVDDHDGFRETLRAWLATAMPDTVVYEAASGEEALALVLAVSPQVVLMDIGLPGMNGIEATRRLLAERPETVVVMVSVRETAVHRAAAAAAGAVAYLPKSGMAEALRPLLGRLTPRQVESPLQPRGAARHAG